MTATDLREIAAILNRMADAQDPLPPPDDALWYPEPPAPNVNTIITAGESRLVVDRPDTVVMGTGADYVYITPAAQRVHFQGGRYERIEFALINPGDPLASDVWFDHCTIHNPAYTPAMLFHCNNLLIDTCDIRSPSFCLYSRIRGDIGRQMNNVHVRDSRMVTFETDQESQSTVRLYQIDGLDFQRNSVDLEYTWKSAFRLHGFMSDCLVAENRFGEGVNFGTPPMRDGTWPVRGLRFLNNHVGPSSNIGTFMPEMVADDFVCEGNVIQIASDNGDQGNVLDRYGYEEGNVIEWVQV